MKYYAVIDTNVIVSAMLKWNSVPGTLVQLVFDGPVIPVLNNEILDEYSNVLHRPKFRLTDEIISAVIDGIKSYLLTQRSLKQSFPTQRTRCFTKSPWRKRKVTTHIW